MNQESILFPIFALGVLTFFVSLWMARLRFVAVKRGDLDRRYYKLNRGWELPDYLVKVSRNFENLLEIPVLFYVVALMIYLTKQADFVHVAMAWLYVGTRFIQPIFTPPTTMSGTARSRSCWVAFCLSLFGCVSSFKLFNPIALFPAYVLYETVKSYRDQASVFRAGSIFPVVGGILPSAVSILH